MRREHKLTPRTLITHSLMSFYLPNANKNLACNQACFFQGRETWGAYFDSDGRIEASDFWLGFFIVQPPN